MTTLKNIGIALTFAAVVSLASFGFAADSQTPTTQVLHRTVKIDGLDIFYREAGPKDAPTYTLELGGRLMHGYPSDIAFTPAVKAIQTEKGSRTSYSTMEERGGWQSTVTPDLEAFLADLDMFYLGTSNAAGQPCIQYRGGAPGFLKVIDEKTLGFADFGGNRQYISLGNLSENPKAFIFLMDYVHSRRIKLWGTARVIEGDADLEDKLSDPDYPGKVERVILFDIEAWDINCPQHIHKRFPQAQVAPIIERLQTQVQELQNKLSQYELTNEVVKP